MSHHLDRWGNKNYNHGTDGNVTNYRKQQIDVVLPIKGDLPAWIKVSSASDIGLLTVDNILLELAIANLGRRQSCLSWAWPYTRILPTVKEAKLLQWHP